MKCTVFLPEVGRRGGRRWGIREQGLSSDTQDLMCLESESGVSRPEGLTLDGDESVS